MTNKNPATHRVLNLVAMALLVPALFVLASCSTSGPTSSGGPTLGPNADFNPGFGGEILTDATSTTATVVSIDHTKRLVVLKRADGSDVTYKAATNAFAFTDIKAGDLVKVSMADEVAVFLGSNGTPPRAGADSAKLRVRIPGGTQAVAAEAGTVAFSAKIMAIDDWGDTVTLQLSDGSTKTIKVSEYVNLSDYDVGDSVSVQSTEAVVILLEKP